jgi:hypothetical protein
MGEMTSHPFGDVPEVGFAKEKTRLALQNLIRVVLRKLGEKNLSANWLIIRGSGLGRGMLKPIQRL